MNSNHLRQDLSSTGEVPGVPDHFTTCLTSRFDSLDTTSTSIANRSGIAGETETLRDEFMNSKRIAIFPAGRRELYERNKYSAAVQSGEFLFVSGQVGSRDDGSPEADPEKQLRLAFTNLVSVLAAAGCSFDDVVDFTVFIVDPERLMPVFFKVKDEFWGEPPYPTLTGIGVTWLYGFHFELKVTARLPDSK